MNKGTCIMTAILVLAAASFWVTTTRADEPQTDQPAKAEIGKPAPDFKLADLAGKEHKLSDLKGKIVVLEWTNRTCPFVMRHQGEEKTMQRLAAKFADKDVVWLAIDSSSFAQEQVEDIRKWCKENKIEYPVLIDADGKVGKVFEAKTTPHMFVVDKNGVLAYSGAIDDDDAGTKEKKRNYVEEAVEALINGSTVPVKMTKSYGCSVKYKD